MSYAFLALTHRYVLVGSFEKFTYIIIHGFPTDSGTIIHSSHTSDATLKGMGKIDQLTLQSESCV